MTEPSQYFKGRTVQEQMDEVIGYVDTRAAEVATTAIASDVAQVHQDMLDADADAQAAAASAAAAAGTLANAVKKTGEASQSIAGNIAVTGTLSGSVVTGTQVTVPAPVNNTDAATKKYVDDQDALDVHLAGSEAITGAKTVPLEATGTFSNQIASSNKVKNELDNYAPMVRTTGNQTIAGDKHFVDWMYLKNPTDTPTGLYFSPFLNYSTVHNGTEKQEVITGFVHENNNDQAYFMTVKNATGNNEATLRFQYLNDGTIQLIMVGNGQTFVIGQINP